VIRAWRSRVGAWPASGALRASAAFHLVLGLGFGVTSVPTLLHFAREGELPMTPFGFRALSGPFEQLGADRFLVLGWIFVGLCAVDVLAGVWLWQRLRRSLWLGLGADVAMFPLAVGFALPALLIGIPLRAALALAGRADLEPAAGTP
jgi:hypothetical protein